MNETQFEHTVKTDPKKIAFLSVNEWPTRVVFNAGIKGIEKIKQILRSELNFSEIAINPKARREAAVFVEQTIESEILRGQIGSGPRAFRRNPVPVTYAVVLANDSFSVTVELRNTRGESAQYGVTRGADPLSEETRTSYINSLYATAESANESWDGYRDLWE